MSIKIYGKKNCSYCEAATILLDTLGEGYEYYDIEASTETFDEMRGYAPTAKTVPVVVINEEYIGGYNELTKHKF